MTVKELSQLYYLNREIEMDRKRLEELQEKSVSCTAVYSGVPSGGGYGDKVGGYVADIMELQQIIDSKMRRCIHERNAIECYIAGIEDSLMRQIFTLRFVHGLRWEQVATRIGGKNTADGCRKTVKRFLSKN